MFELGVESDKEHIELINFCLKNNFDDIFLIGNEFYKHKNLFNQPNFYKTKDELSNHLKKMPLKSELILIKGSRGMKMENVIKYIF
jgi:UDP-N-acetylmuramoyl-tripeptide--D-alanyl-D-alanine ligase